MLVTSLERVNDAQDLSGVAACAGGVGEDGADGLLRIDDEDAADCESDAFLVDVCGVLVVDPEFSLISNLVLCLPAVITGIHLHVIHERDLSLLVADDGEAQLAPGDLIDVLDPAAVAVDCVCAQADELDASFRELWLELGEGTQLGCAYWCVVFRMREEDGPVVADEFVEVDVAVGGVGIEVWCRVT